MKFLIGLVDLLDVILRKITISMKNYHLTKLQRLARLPDTEDQSVDNQMDFVI